MLTPTMEAQNEPNAAETTDSELISLSRKGEQAAYGKLVERYQSLVCSVAYCRCGDLSLSEDLAQEAFVQAWQKLSTLNDADKFKSWICTITRNLATRSMEGRSSELLRSATSLDSANDVAATSASSIDRAVSAEEESLVWNALSELPENYREPMILFYREDQSVARVAGSLELAEATVKQRLSRGRKMLREQLMETVESTLLRSKPAKTFASAVLMAIAGMKSKSAAAAVGVAAATKAAAKVGLGASVGPFIAFLPVIGSFWLAGAAMYQSVMDDCESDEERKLTLRFTLWMLAEAAVFSVYVILAIWFNWPLLISMVLICAWQFRIGCLSKRHYKEVEELRERLAKADVKNSR